MPRSFPFLLAVVCLMLLAMPAQAGAVRSYVTGHFAMDLGSDAAALLQQIAGEPLLAEIISKPAQKQFAKFLDTPVTANLIVVGDLRAKAAEKKKKVSSYDAIKEAKPRTLDEMHAWTEESLDTLATIREGLEDHKDSLNDLGEMDQLRLQRLMEQLDQLEAMLSNILKKMAEQEEEITHNIK